ncbi:KLHL4 [Symbiodinium microadriaticum]|nr:KLHL4 [Symbiodinium microadriaticum]
MGVMPHLDPSFRNCWPGLLLFGWLAVAKRNNTAGFLSWVSAVLPLTVFLLRCRLTCSLTQQGLVIEHHETEPQKTAANLMGLRHFQDLLEEMLQVAGQVAAGRLATSNRSWAQGLQAHLHRERQRPSKLQLRIFYIGGRELVEAHSAQDHVQQLNVDSKSWQEVAQLPGARWAATAAVLRGEILVMGGYADGQDLDLVDAFDPKRGAWRRQSQLKLTCPRSMFAAAVLDGRVYIVGGTSSGRELDLCERCDGEGWEPATSLPFPRFGCSAVAAGGLLYTVGGFSGGMALRCCQRLDLSSSWITLPSPKVARWSAAAVTLHGKIYVCGGYNGGTPLSLVERFSPDADTWEVLPSLTTPRKHLAAVRAGDSVYVLGGFDGTTSTSAVESLGVSGTWEEMPPLPRGSEWGVAAAMFL